MIQPTLKNSRWNDTRVRSLYRTDEGVVAELRWWEIVNTFFDSYIVIIDDRKYDVCSLHFYNQGTHIEAYCYTSQVKWYKIKYIVKSEKYEVQGKLEKK